MPRSARLAIWFSFLLHGILILSARYRAGYDAYVHIFFGDHYRIAWWSLWDPRWYTGFFVSSYPPLVHQLIGLLSHLIGLEAAFAFILWATLTLLPLAVYSFARVFVGKYAAGYASLGAALMPSVYLTAHIFGQLPTLVATTTALFGIAALNQYLHNGTRFDLALAVSLMATVMASHHATLLLLPWLILAVVFHLLSNKQIGRRALLVRLSLFSILSALATLVVIWPFWDWGRTQTIQIPIDHLSRHNFFKDWLAPVLFFLPIYGPLMLIIPFAFFLAYKRQLIGLGFAFLMLFLLGLGDTTPLPRLFFGKGWEWLTYDRFAFWASLALLPFFGIIVVSLRHNYTKSITPKIFFSLAITSLIVGLITAILPLQPGPVEMKQVVDFLEQNDRARWRYLTFGFGDQLALLSTLTTATTIDGSYHTARNLPELRTSGIAQIDTAYWSAKGLAALDPILQKAGDYGVRWGFVNVPYYIPALERNNWIKIKTLNGGVQVWENPKAVLPERSQPPISNPLAEFLWGTLPILSLVTSLALGSLRLWPAPAEKILRGIHAFLNGLIPMGLCFWYYRTLGEFTYSRVYFTYTNPVFFLSDAPASLAVILWLSAKAVHRSRNTAARLFGQPRFIFLSLSFIILTSMSTLWSPDWHTSLYISLHIWLAFGLFLSLRDWPEAWTSLMLGFCAALSIQVITGFVEFVTQSTAFLVPLDMKWPGLLASTVRGASIVQLPNGISFLRAYGTLPHPNILGGFGLAFLLGPIALILRRGRPNWLAALLVGAGVSLLALTFSRSTWLALMVFALVLTWKRKSFNRRRLVILLIVGILSFAFTLLPLRDLVQARTVNPTSHSEEFSILARTWLSQEALQMIRERPLTGFGIGSFVIELAKRAGEGYIIEPVHNILLLAAAELGIPGLLLLSVIAISFGYHMVKLQKPEAILAGAAFTSLGVIGLLDHYFWTLAPGRLMLGLMFGLWAGQVDENG